MNAPSTQPANNGQTTANQTSVDALFKVLDDLMHFVLEDYYPNCATPAFKAAG